jgi:hypothetical protein
MASHPEEPLTHYSQPREREVAYIFRVFGRENSGQEEIWNLETTSRLKKITG